MPSYGDVIYNPSGAVIARYNLNNTYGTPGVVDYMGKFMFNYESDTDELKVSGAIVETLSIPTKAVGEMEQLSLDFVTWGLLTGYAADEYGSNPNRYYQTDVRFGGEGVPYCGIIIAYTATNGANALVGFPKFKIDTPMGFDVDQNKFRKASVSLTAVGVGPRYRGVRIRKHETAAALPTTPTAFLQFFTVPGDMFAG